MDLCTDGHTEKKHPGRPFVKELYARHLLYPRVLAPLWTPALQFVKEGYTVFKRCRGSLFLDLCTDGHTEKKHPGRPFVKELYARHGKLGKTTYYAPVLH